MLFDKKLEISDFIQKIKNKLRDSYICILGIIIILSLIISFHKLNQTTVRDFFIIVGVIILPELSLRFIYGFITNKGKIKNIFLIKLREENIKKLIKKVENKEPLAKNINQEIKRLTASSLPMLGILSVITLTLIMLTLSGDTNNNIHRNGIELEIFTVSGFVTFLLFVINLAHSYSILEPSMDDIILIQAMKRYYRLTMCGIFMLGGTFVWGIYSHTDLFHVDTPIPGLLSLVSLLIFLTVLYYTSYIYKIPIDDADDLAA